MSAGDDDGDLGNDGAEGTNSSGSRRHHEKKVKRKGEEDSSQEQKVKDDRRNSTSSRSKLSRSKSRSKSSSKSKKTSSKEKSDSSHSREKKKKKSSKKSHRDDASQASGKECDSKVPRETTDSRRQGRDDAKTEETNCGDLSGNIASHDDASNKADDVVNQEGPESQLCSKFPSESNEVDDVISQEEPEPPIPLKYPAESNEVDDCSNQEDPEYPLPSKFSVESNEVEAVDDQGSTEQGNLGLVAHPAENSNITHDTEDNCKQTIEKTEEPNYIGWSGNMISHDEASNEGDDGVVQEEPESPSPPKCPTESNEVDDCSNQEDSESPLPSKFSVELSEVEAIDDQGSPEQGDLGHVVQPTEHWNITLVAEDNCKKTKEKTEESNLGDLSRNITSHDEASNEGNDGMNQEESESPIPPKLPAESNEVDDYSNQEEPESPLPSKFSVELSEVDDQGSPEQGYLGHVVQPTEHWSITLAADDNWKQSNEKTEESNYGDLSGNITSHNEASDEGDDGINQEEPEPPIPPKLPAESNEVDDCSNQEEPESPLPSKFPVVLSEVDDQRSPKQGNLGHVINPTQNLNITLDSEDICKITTDSEADGKVENMACAPLVEAPAASPGEEVTCAPIAEISFSGDGSEISHELDDEEILAIDGCKLDNSSTTVVEADVSNAVEKAIPNDTDSAERDTCLVQVNSGLVEATNVCDRSDAGMLSVSSTERAELDPWLFGTGEIVLKEDTDSEVSEQDILRLVTKEETTATNMNDAEDGANQIPDWLQNVAGTVGGVGDQKVGDANGVHEVPDWLQDTGLPVDEAENYSCLRAMEDHGPTNECLQNSTKKKRLWLSFSWRKPKSTDNIILPPDDLPANEAS